MLGAFKGSYSNALMSLFPEIGLDSSKFKRVPRMDNNFYYFYNCFVLIWFSGSHWMTMKNKMFFDNFARQRGFDPLVASNWYGVRHEDVTTQKVI